MSAAAAAAVGAGRLPRLVAWALLLLALAAPAADGLVPVPPLGARLTDLTGSLTAEQQAGLEQTLRAFEARKGSQLAVLIVPSTQPEAIEAFALRVVAQWKLGRRRVDDGALLLIAKNDRALRIEVGYGLEGVLNDATAKRIVSEVIAPRLGQGDYFGGVSAGVAQLIRVIDGEALPAPPRQPAGPAKSPASGQLLPMLLVLALVMGRVLRPLLGRVPGALATGGLLALAGWLLGGAVLAVVMGGVLAFAATLMGLGMGRHGGLYGLGYGAFGGGRGGGGGGGGFGGGGGSFGGGGASGRF